MSDAETNETISFPSFYDAAMAYVRLCNDILNDHRFIPAKEVEVMDPWFRTWSCVHTWSFENPHDLPPAD